MLSRAPHAHSMPCGLTPCRNEGSPVSPEYNLATVGKPAACFHADNMLAATSDVSAPSSTVQVTPSAAFWRGIRTLCRLQVGKSLLVRCLIKHYTRQSLSEVRGPITIVAGKQRRLTFVECPQARRLTPGSPCPCMQCREWMHTQYCRRASVTAHGLYKS